MNFFDYGFVFLFMPAVLVGAALTRRLTQRLQFGFLIFASFVFYCSWDTSAPGVLAASICINYLIGQQLYQCPNRLLLSVTVAGNLITLGYYKYMLFLTSNIAKLTAFPVMAGIILPLGISFFTFQQISYLVDSFRRQTVKHNFLSYALFICLFPHLVAGPIVLQSDVLRQLGRRWALVVGPWHLASGLALFTLGLAKKIILADSFAGFATDLFTKVQHSDLSASEAWQAALAYSFQIYFDFSGYSDMAIGLAYCLGLRLPFNFNSPYKSLSISEFWRRWHISLSRFLKHYLYIPLGGNRHGTFRTYRNLMVVMMLGGLWHGANWTFILWGTLHGIMLAINHYWRRRDKKLAYTSWIGRAGCWLATFTAVVFAWVPFRAPDVPTTISIWRSMLTFHFGDAAPSWSFCTLALAAILGCLLLPNSQQLVFCWESWVPQDRQAYCHIAWRPTTAWGLAVGLLFVVAMAWQWQVLTPPEFIYFNF
jgi:alginate O-acetyltransferase complex protein AlgI